MVAQVLPEFMVLRIAEVGGRKERSEIHELGVQQLVERIKPGVPRHATPYSAYDACGINQPFQSMHD